MYSDQENALTSPDNAGITIAIVNAREFTSRTFVDWIQQAPDFRCVGNYNGGKRALANLPTKTPSVVLIDSHLPDMSGIDCLRRLKRMLPATEFVMFTAYEDVDFICEALKAGANGCLSKTVTKEELLAALRAVYIGGSPISHRIARKIVQTFRRSPADHLAPAGLSTRQLEVLELLARGQSFTKIASQFNVTLETTKTHVRRTYKKLNVNSRAQAVAVYMQISLR